MVYVEMIGKPVSRGEAIRIVDGILERAEREREELMMHDMNRGGLGKVVNPCVCCDMSMWRCCVCEKWFCEKCGEKCLVCGKNVCRLCSEKAVKLGSSLSLFFPGVVCKGCVEERDLRDRDAEGRLVVDG